MDLAKYNNNSAFTGNFQNGVTTVTTDSSDNSLKAIK